MPTATDQKKVTFTAPVRALPDKDRPPETLTNIRRITEADMAKASVFTWTPVWAGHVRVEVLPDRPEQFGGFMLLCLVHYDGTGYLIDNDFWGGSLRFYAFGCEHAFVEVSRPANHRSGLHHDRCTKCGFDHHYDTSD